MWGQPSIWGSVGVPNLRTNHSATSGWAHANVSGIDTGGSSGTIVELVGSPGGTCSGNGNLSLVIPTKGILRRSVAFANCSLSRLPRQNAAALRPELNPMGMSDSVWHEGELEIQRRAGVAEEAGELQGMVRPGIAPPVAVFLSQRQFAVLTSIDSKGRPWASPVVGLPGFIRALDPVSVEVLGGWSKTDLLVENLQANPQVGMLAIDFNNRRRVRINGRAELGDGVMRIRTEQVFSNCPKYIQARIPEQLTSGVEPVVSAGGSLDAAQKEWLLRADTFFIASAHPQHGADASHRGGHPGFIRVNDDRHLTFPDYTGNNLFNTLGNIQLNPKAGLLFVDFDSGRVLQLTGTATVNWDEEARAAFPGAQRLVQFEIEEVRETEGGAPLRFTFRTYSPFNPQL